MRHVRTRDFTVNEILYDLQIQKKKLSAATICGNTVFNGIFQYYTYMVKVK